MIIGGALIDRTLTIDSRSQSARSRSDVEIWRQMTRTLVVLAMSLLLPGLGRAQPPAVWGDLTPGAHGVGYDMIEIVDSSRVVRRSSDAAGLGA